MLVDGRARAVLGREDWARFSVAADRCHRLAQAANEAESGEVGCFGWQIKAQEGTTDSSDKAASLCDGPLDLAFN